MPIKNLAIAWQFDSLFAVMEQKPSPEVQVAWTCVFSFSWTFLHTRPVLTYLDFDYTQIIIYNKETGFERKESVRQRDQTQGNWYRQTSHTVLAAWSSVPLLPHYQPRRHIHATVAQTQPTSHPLTHFTQMHIPSIALVAFEWQDHEKRGNHCHKYWTEEGRITKARIETKRQKTWWKTE